MRIVFFILMLLAMSCRPQPSAPTAPGAAHGAGTGLAGSNGPQVGLSHAMAARAEVSTAAASTQDSEEIKPRLSLAVSNVITRAMAGRTGTNLYTLFTQQRVIPNAAFPDGLSTNFWLRGLRGWQALANDTEFFQLPTLVSRYHAVVASHSWANPMPWVRWIGTNGVAYTNRALATTNIGISFPPSVPYGDFKVIVFATPVNAAVPSVPMASLAALTNFGAVPAVAVGHASTATSGTNYWAMLGSVRAGVYPGKTDGIATVTPATGGWRSWWTYAADFGFNGFVGGDSGLVRFIPLENRIVLLGTVSLSSGTGPMPSVDEVQAAMNALSDQHGLPRQQLEVETFSAYRP